MAYTKYTGGNKKLDDLLKQQSDRYNSAREQGDVEGMREANDRANQIRNEYGYAAESAENDISYIKGITGYNGGGRSSSSSSSSGSRRQSYSYEDAPTYTSKYQGMIDDLLGQYMDRPAFSYDAESDPTYLALRDQYTTMGQNAMQDTLGQISARTGGLASSYAGSAAQQMYNSYMNELSGFLPELEQLAYERWQDQGNDLLSQIDLLTALEQGDYGKYQDLLNQYNADRAFDYGLYSDEWNRNYQTGRDAIADQRYDQEWAYGVMQDQQNRQDQLDMNRAELLAATGDFSGYADIFGLSEAETQRLVDQYARQQGLTEAQAARDLADWMAQYGDLSGLQGLGVDTSYQEQLQDAQLADIWSGIYARNDSGSSSSRSDGSGAMDYEGLFEAAMESGHPKSFLANNYRDYGFNSSSGLSSDYDAWIENGGADAAQSEDSGLEQLERQLLDLQDRLNPSDVPRNALELIQGYYERGSITEDTARRLLAGYGFNA